jgi:two-component system, cell cycle sensor histidine kinase and response regulator CckA
VVKPSGDGKGAEVTSRGETILVAGHDQVIRRLVCGALAREGYHIVQAPSAEAAVRTAARHESEIDLLLTETLLPTSRGCELAELVRLDYPDLEVIYISGSTGAESGSRDRRSRVVVVQEPFPGDRLRRAVREALAKHKNKVRVKFPDHSWVSILRSCWNRVS